MSKRLEKLMFTIGLIDKTRGPASRVMGTIDKINQRTQQGIRQSAVGAVGLAGTAYALQAALSPAIEMDRALGEVSSLFDTDKNLQGLRDTAIDFSVKYGESAADFVKASYDIQSAIAGLKGNELAKFTESSAILAKATKADASTITDYMGTMYSIFKKDAKRLGNENWVQQVAGQTATAVQMFKTTGSKMASAFGALGADATAHGIAMSEQIAVIGTLGASMSGSESATKYRSFLAGVGKAQKELGLNFTDTQGKMLSMPAILKEIYGKFGQIDTVAKGDALQKAFGSKQAVGLVKALMQDMDGLSGSMVSLAKVSGMDKAVQMAQKQIDPWERAGAAIKGVSIAFGTQLLPVITPLINKLTAGNEQVIKWTRMFPSLTRAVGVAVLIIFGVVAALSAFAIVVGIAKIMVVGFSLVLGVLKTVMLAFKAVLLIAKGLIWLFNAALLANPIVWIILAIVAVLAIVGVAIYHVVKHWDAISAAAIVAVDKTFNAFNKIPEYFTKLKNWFKNLDLFSFLNTGAFDKISSFLGIADKEKANLKQALPSLNSQISADIEGGGINNHLSKSFNQSRSVGNVVINTTQKPDGHFIHDELEAAAT